MIRDDFAGPGGWDVALDLVGYTGERESVEWDKAACATAVAAGYPRQCMDVRRVLSPRGSLDGAISSPPCQTYSPAGPKGGVGSLAAILAAVEMVADGIDPATAVAIANAETDFDLDERSVLVLHPLQVVADARPRWVVLEQVKTVLPIWEAFAVVLRRWGYHVWTGIGCAEQYGVPQARRRAVLIASLDREVGRPTPTHSQFHHQAKTRLDAGVLPWVTMADATQAAGLGSPQGAVPGDFSWMVERPSPTIVGSFRPEIVAAPGYRKPGDPPRQKTPGSVRITLAQAAVLQGFPADYPWQGSVAKQWEQVGNAVPPPMGAAILAQVI